MYKDCNVEQGAVSLDHRDVEQIVLSWHLIHESDPDFLDHMARILDKRYVDSIVLVVRPWLDGRRTFLIDDPFPLRS